MPLNRTFNRFGSMGLIGLIAFGAAKNYKTDFPSLAEVDKKTSAKALKMVHDADLSVPPEKLVERVKNLNRTPDFKTSRAAYKYYYLLGKLETKYRKDIYDYKLKNKVYDKQNQLQTKMQKVNQKYYKNEISDTELEKAKEKHYQDAITYKEKYLDPIRKKVDKEFLEAIKNFGEQNPEMAKLYKNYVRSKEARQLSLKANCAKLLGLGIKDLYNFEFLSVTRTKYHSTLHRTHFSQANPVFKLKNGDDAAWVTYKIKNPDDNNHKSLYTALWNLNKNYLIPFIPRTDHISFNYGVPVHGDEDQAIEIYESSIKKELEKDGKRLVCCTNPNRNSQLFHFVCTNKDGENMRPDSIYLYFKGPIYKFPARKENQHDNSVQAKVLKKFSQEVIKVYNQQREERENQISGPFPKLSEDKLKSKDERTNTPGLLGQFANFSRNYPAAKDMPKDKKKEAFKFDHYPPKPFKYSFLGKE